MTTKELFKMLSDKLLPIIANDQDIINVIKKNNMSEDELSWFIHWLINASIWCFLNGSTGETEKKLVQNCTHDMSAIETKLQELGYDENVRATLIEILEENIGEWFEILKKEFENSSEGKNDENVATEEAQNTDPVSATFKIYTSFLGNVVDREDDVTELLEKYSQVNKDALRFYVIGQVFYAYLKQIESGDIKPPKQSQVFKHHKKLIKLTGECIQHLFDEYMKDEIEDVKQLNDDIGELLNDHFNEFIKKTFKQIFKTVDEINKR